MDFYTIRELRTTSRRLWDDLSENGEVVITNNGKPTALMIGLDDWDMDDAIAAIRQAQVMRAVNRMRQQSVRGNLDKMTEEEIEEEIRKAREDL